MTGWPGSARGGQVQLETLIQFMRRMVCVVQQPMLINGGHRGHPTPCSSSTPWPGWPARDGNMEMTILCVGEPQKCGHVMRTTIDCGCLHICMHFWMFLFLRVSVAYAINFQPDHFAHREPNSRYVHELPSATGHHRRCGRFLATNTEFARGEYGN